MKQRIVKAIGWLLLFSVIAIIAFVARTCRAASLDGPTSAAGHTVRIRVSDMQFGTGADFYADVTIRESNGAVVARWDDPSGQDSWENAKAMTRSMKWIDNETLVFQTEDGSTVTLTTKKGS